MGRGSKSEPAANNTTNLDRANLRFDGLQVRGYIVNFCITATSKRRLNGSEGRTARGEESHRNDRQSRGVQSSPNEIAFHGSHIDRLIQNQYCHSSAPSVSVERLREAAGS